MVAFVGSDTFSNNTTNDVDFTLPAHQAGDVAIAFLYHDENATEGWAVSSGWTQLLAQTDTGGRDRVISIQYRRFTSSSESNPSFSTTETASLRKTAILNILRDVNSTTFDVTTTSVDVQDTINATPAAITTATDSACILLFQALSHSEVTAAGAPSGYTLGGEIIGGFHRNAVSAYLLDAGTAGVKSPGAFTNTGTVSSTDTSVYTLAIRPAIAPSGSVADSFTEPSTRPLHEPIFKPLGE